MTDINDVFELDPLNYTTENIDALIAKYRASRTQWKAGEKAPKEPKTKVELKMDDLKDLLS